MYPKCIFIPSLSIALPLLCPLPEVLEPLLCVKSDLSIEFQKCFPNTLPQALGLKSLNGKQTLPEDSVPRLIDPSIKNLSSLAWPQYLVFFIADEKLNHAPLIPLTGAPVFMPKKNVLSFTAEEWLEQLPWFVIETPEVEKHGLR
jgi:hypothetical protein